MFSAFFQLLQSLIPSTRNLKVTSCGGNLKVWRQRDTTGMSLSKDLTYLILQFCDEEGLKRTAHMLEQETGIFFDMK